MKYLIVATCLFSAALARPDGAGHDHSHAHNSAAAAPVSGYSEPSSAYGGATGSGYAAPDTSYGSPEPSYSAPSSSYDGYQGYEPATGYDAAGYDAATGGSYDTSYESTEVGSNFPNLSLIIIPLIIVAGIFLLFPQTTLVSVRRRRDAEDEVSGNSVVERVQDIYNSLVESEECMERVACEIGGLAQEVGVNKAFISSAQTFVPSKYSKYMKNFTTGKDCHKIKCGNFF